MSVDPHEIMLQHIARLCIRVSALERRIAALELRQYPATSQAIQPKLVPSAPVELQPATATHPVVVTIAPTSWESLPHGVPGSPEYERWLAEGLRAQMEDE